MRTWLMLLTISLASSWQQSAATSGGAEPSLAMLQFERLSFDLRGHRLADSERDEITHALAAGTARALYTHDLDNWLTKDALKSFVATYLKFPPLAVISPDAESFFHRTAKTGDVYYLPGADQAACAFEDVETVQAWWAKAPIRVCKASYVPEKIFDTVGYCSGGAEPLMTQPLRSGCGCGPMLVGCLPPVGDNVALDQLVRTAVGDEWFETAARTVKENRPLDELLTTTRTWQSGLGTFLYARREVLADYRATGWNATLARRITNTLAAIDVYAPARWVERSSTYRGTGIWWTALVAQALKIPIRAGAHHLLDRYLCTAFTSANVDTEAVLAAVGNHPENLRTLSSLTAAPMRFQAGCKGCHSPMDGAGGFMGDLEGAIYGSYVTGKRSAGAFFVSGDHDFRGSGTGTASLSSYVVAAPEFESCAVRRAFEQVMQTPPTSRDQQTVADLKKQFHDNGHRWAPVIRTLLLSDGYLHQGQVVAEDPGPHEIPASVAKVIAGACTRCHDSTHELDLTKLPAASETETWKAILTRVGDSTMPPGKMDDDLANRFPLDPSDRRSLVAGVSQILGSALDTPAPPRRLPHKVWLSIVRAFAEPSLGHEPVEALLAPLTGNTGFFGKLPARGLPPAYLLAIENASEAVCRAVASKTTADLSSEDSLKHLMLSVYGQPPTATEFAAEETLARSFETRIRDPREAWAALCSSELSGPKLLFSDYVGRSAR